MNLTLTIRDGATPAIKELADTITSPGALTSGGRGLRNAIASNFDTLPPNKNFPAQTTGFWQQCRESLTQPILEGAASVRVSVTQIGARYQYLGGTIVPRIAKMLTIPAREEAYGKRAREFNNLQIERLGIGPSGSPILALVERESQEISYRKRKGAIAVQRGSITGGLVMFWLVNSVSKGPSPEVLPRESVMRVAFANGVRSFVNSKHGSGSIALGNLISLKDLSA